MVSVREVLDLLPTNRRNSARSWGAYTLLYNQLAASATAQKASVTTSDKSDFILMRMKAYATDTAAPPVELTSPQATLLLQIGSDNLFPDGTGIHVGNLAVSAASRHGHDLEWPVYIPANTALNGIVANLTATAFILRIVCYGVRLFGYQKGSSTL